MNKTICGVVVDEEYFKEFMKRNFKVLDKNVKANVVEIYATSRDYAENAPEYTEAAQKVREQIRAEIQSYYAAKDGRKEYKAMKHQNFGGYLGDLKELFLQASKEREVLKQKFDKAGETWKREEVETRGNEYEHTKARMDYMEAEKTYKESVGVQEKLDALSGSMTNFGNKMSLAVTAPLVALGGKMVSSASDMEENLNKVDVAFGKSADKVKSWADTATEAFGLSKNQALEATSLFGDLH